MEKRRLLFVILILLQIVVYSSGDSLKVFLNEMNRMYANEDYKDAIDQIENYLKNPNLIDDNDSTLYKIKKLQVEILYVKARVFLNKGDYNQAIVFYNQALIKFNKYKIKDNETEAFLYHIIGFCYQVMEDYKTAGKYFDRALTIDLSDHPDDLASIYSDQAINKIHTGKQDESINYFRKAIQLIKLKNIDQVRTLASTYEAYGLVLLKNGDFKRCEEILLESNRMLKSIYGNDYSNNFVSLSNNYIAYMYDYEGLYKKAVQYTHEVLTGMSASFNDTSIYSTPKKENLVVNSNFLYALKLEAHMLFKLFKKDTANVQCLIASINHYNSCFDLIEKSRFEHMDEESSLSFAKDYREIIYYGIKAAYEYYKLYKTPDNLDKLFKYCEKGKASILYQSIADLDAKSNARVPKKLIEYGEKLDKAITSLKEILKQKPSEKVRTALYYCAEKRQDYYKLLKEKFPEYYRLRYDLSTITIDEIKARLRDNEVFLEYTLTGDLLLCFAITSNTCELYVSDKGKNITVTTNKLLPLLHSQPENSFDYGQFKKDSRYLYNQLIQPVKHLIAGKKIIVVPDDILMYLAYDVLLDENEQYLVQSNPISYAYSATLKYRKKHPAKLTATVGAFVPSYNTNSTCSDHRHLKDLKYARIEAEWVSAMLNGDCFVNENATEENFIKHAKKYSIIHLALHTTINEDDPLLSALIFSCNEKEPEKESLKLFELYDMELNNGLVFLGGCSTGYGKLFKGEGLINITRAFLYSGSRSIVFSLWEINDKSGYDIVKSFYSYLKKGYPVDVSLQKAKCYYLNNSVKLKSFPYYWAAYNIVGDNSLSYKVSGKIRLIYVIVSLIVLAFVGVVLFKQMKKH